MGGQKLFPETTQTIEEHYQMLDAMPVAGDIKINGKWLAEENEIRRAVAEAIIPKVPSYRKSKKSKSPKDNLVWKEENPEKKKENDNQKEKLYYRVNHVYSGKRDIANNVLKPCYEKNITGDQLIDEAAVTFCESATCRPPGIVADSIQSRVLSRRSCGMCYVCPFCTFRRMLDHGSLSSKKKGYGPAHEMNAALNQGIDLHWMEFHVLGYDYSIARDFRRSLVSRLRQTVKPAGCWISLLPHMPSLGDRHRIHVDVASEPLYSVRAVVAGASYEEVCGSWKPYKQSWRREGSVICDENMRGVCVTRPLESAVYRLAYLFNQLVNPYTPAPQLIRYVEMVPKYERYQIFTGFTSKTLKPTSSKNRSHGLKTRKTLI